LGEGLTPSPQERFTVTEPWMRARSTHRVEAPGKKKIKKEFSFIISDIAWRKK
jgi:hypothetical protein